MAQINNILQLISKILEALEQLTGLDLGILQLMIDALGGLHDSMVKEYRIAIMSFYMQYANVLRLFEKVLGYVVPDDPQEESSLEEEKSFRGRIDTITHNIIQMRQNPNQTLQVKQAIEHILTAQLNLYKEIIEPWKKKNITRLRNRLLNFLDQVRMVLGRSKEGDVFIQEETDHTNIMIHFPQGAKP